MTTNPPVSTGDGVAAAFRAGARLRDIEFIQFHPTVLYLGRRRPRPAAAGQRGRTRRGRPAGQRRGERFMVGQHELAELAPRDVVAKGIMKEMAREGSDHVCVDGRALGEEIWRVRFPTILHSCRRAGINPATDLIPVAPGLSLLLRRRARPTSTARPTWPGSTPAARWPPPGCTAPTGWPPTPCSRGWSSPAGSPTGCTPTCRRAADRPLDDREPGLIDPAVVPAMQQSMSRYAGGLRTADGLDQCAAELSPAGRQERRPNPGWRPGRRPT